MDDQREAPTRVTERLKDMALEKLEATAMGEDWVQAYSRGSEDTRVRMLMALVLDDPPLLTLL